MSEAVKRVAGISTKNLLFLLFVTRSDRIGSVLTVFVCAEYAYKRLLVTWECG